MKFKLNAKVTSASSNGGDPISIYTEPSNGGAQDVLEADVVLVAVGRRPYTAGLGLEKIGVDLDSKGRVIIDDQFNTTVPGVRAIGDVVAGPMLAHKAEDEGIAVAEIIKKGHGHVNYEAIPSVVYTHPEVAWVGKNEEDLKKMGVSYNVGKFPFLANSRAKTNVETEGFVKFLTDKDTDKILGVHIIGTILSGGAQRNAHLTYIMYRPECRRDDRGSDACIGVRRVCRGCRAHVACSCKLVIPIFTTRKP